MAVAYKRFLTLLVTHPETTVAPSKDIDKFWHGHILDTMKYAEDCERVFGYFLHHFPYFGMRGTEDAAQQAQADKDMHRLYEQEFGEPMPQSAGAYCGATVAKAAYCGAAKPAYCGAATKAAYCGAAKPVKETAYCGAMTTAAYCGAATKAAYCGAAKPTKNAAYCGAAKPAYCGTTTKAAYCGAAKPVKNAAYCGAAKPSYCGAAKKTNDAAYCGAAVGTSSKQPDFQTRPALAQAA
jgi:hypothetical protein